jgi:hypothetical protein
MTATDASPPILRFAILFPILPTFHSFLFQMTNSSSFFALGTDGILGMVVDNLNSSCFNLWQVISIFLSCFSSLEA